MYCYPGIYNGRAKNPDYSKYEVRQQTFEDRNDFNKSLAQAGFYRGTGCPGCVTCFYCAVSIRGLEPGENAWVEHAKYSPNCEYLKLHKGEKFIQRARDMTDHEETMKQDEGKDLESTDTDQMIEDLNSRASMMMMDKGYTQEDIEHGILKARQKYGNGELKAAKIFEFLFDTKSIQTPVKFCSATPSRSTSSYQAPSSFTFSKMETTEPLDEDHRKLIEENLALKSRMTCKICMDANACVLFVPCGHMVSCLNCATMLTTCAVCRAEITDTIRAYPA